MDQLRKIFGWLKKQHFWVLSVLVAVIAYVCWWSGSGTLSTETKANKTAIEGEFTTMATLRSKPFHPNETIQQKQIEETKKEAEHVKATWQQLYDRQRENVLEWPAALSQAFRDYVEKQSFGAEIPTELRDNYQNYVERHFPKLPETVVREMLPGEAGYSGGEGSYGGSRTSYSREGGNANLAGMPADNPDDYICEWLDQGRVREELNFPQRPSAIRIWVTQEDLWVYHTLLQAIANTNKAAGATRMSNAAIRVIYSLEVGKRAAIYSRGKGRIYMLPSATPTDPTLMEPGAEGAGGNPYAEGSASSEYSGGREGEAGGYSMYGGEGGMSGPTTPEQERGFLLTGRYLDDTGKPIVAAGGMDPAAVADPTMAPDPTVPAAAPSPSEFGTEYKRLPVRMTLKMDQRWLTRLLSECANQPLQIEVQEVRINPAGGLGGEGGGGGGYGGGRSYDGGGGMGASVFPERTGIQTFPAQPHIVDVVIQGVIYIFNAPNPDVLQTPQEEPQVAMAEN